MIKKHWLYPKKTPMPSTATSIDIERLKKLIYMIRQSDMPSSVKRLNVDKLLIAVDIIKRCEIERLISVVEAAKLRDVSRQTIWKMLKSGTLTPYKVAGYTVIDRDELMNLPPKGELRWLTVATGRRKARKS